MKHTALHPARDTIQLGGSQLANQLGFDTQVPAKPLISRLAALQRKK